MKKTKQPRTIAIDFDGVLHEYEGYKGGQILGPRPGAKQAVTDLLQAGHTVVVFTTRPSTLVAPWLQEHGFPSLPVTATKSPFWAIIDDRAICFDGNWDRALAEIEGFEPYWLKKRRIADTRPVPDFGGHAAYQAAEDRGYELFKAETRLVQQIREAFDADLRQRSARQPEPKDLAAMDRRLEDLVAAIGLAFRTDGPPKD